MKENELDQTDGSFTNSDGLIRKGLSDPFREVDSFHVNRFGEQKPTPVLGREDEAPGTEHFEHDPSYSWSKDSRSESSDERISRQAELDEGEEADRRSDEFILNQIEAALRRKDLAKLKHVGFRVESGIVFVSGEVASERDKDMIDQVVSEIYGVTGLMNTVNFHSAKEVH